MEVTGVPRLSVKPRLALPMQEKGELPMIELTRLNGQRFRVNCDLIKSSEASPDTVLTLVTGEKLVVMESPSQVVEAMVGYRAEVLRTAWPDAALALGARAMQSVVGPAAQRGAYGIEPEQAAQ